MAHYLLPKSPTYEKKTGDKLNRRRQVVCRYLNDVYKVPKNKDDETFQKIVEELASEGIAISNVQYQSDKVVLRSAYVWLNEKDEKKKTEIAERKSPASGAIKYLLVDNLLSWDDLTKEEPPQPEAEEQAAESPLAPGPKLAAHEAGKEVARNFGLLVASLEDMLGENELLIEENQRLQRQHADDDAYIDYMDSEYAALEERLKEVKQGMRHLHSATLEEIAAEHPEFPQLYVIAQQMKASPARRQKQFNELVGRLPKAFTWPNDSGAMIYETHFLRALSDRGQDEQDQVIKQIGYLVTEGPEYHSLHTRKCEMRLLHSPPDCMSSRGAETLRFTWKKNGDVHVYWLFPKGHSRVRQSEA